MNLAMLSTLTAILDHGSFAAAADEVGCTPSAVSLQVKQMESYFGQPLFDRSGRSVRPTAFAHEVGHAAREMAGRIGALRSRPALRVAGRVRLGAIATVQTDALPQVLRGLRDRHPELGIRVSLNDSEALLADLKANRIDAAVVVRPATGGTSRLFWQDLARQPFVMLAPPQATGSAAQLLGRHDWIRYDTALTGGRAAAQYVQRIAPGVRPAMDVRSIDAIVAMVASDLGLTVVPKPRAPLLAAYPVREIALGANAPSRRIALVRRLADSDSRNIDAVQQVFAAVYAG